ncbi:nicotinamide-nucleotide adenylyltransferase [Candidatus Acetothermia bacterium]|nr:nicotinamide-nucleotide adenylyltransferase [Candidatus Acetothermia bacterium]MBI3643273.1 nicotinamide-nucleotide adenylyltransferase [Candidatus Acetothermia bacterium]
MKKSTRALFLGRFQPYHNGHDAVIRKITAEVNELIIAVGSAQYSHTLRDPFTAGERIMMITRALAGLKSTKYVLPIEDIEQNALYVAHIRRLTPAFDLVYSNNSLVIRLFEEAGIAVKQLPLIDRGHLWGTKIRDLMTQGGLWQTYVPPAVCTIIEEIGGIERLQQIQQSDLLSTGPSSSASSPRRGESD